MRTNSKRALIALGILAPAAIAWTAATEILTLQPQSRLWAVGTSNVRGFECKAGTIETRVEANTGAIQLVAAGEKAVQTVTVKVPVASLDCGNGTMTNHMREALKAEAAPVVTFTLEDYDLAKSDSAVKVTLNGTLELGGVTKPISFAATAKEESGALHVTGAYTLKLTDYGLKPPRLMMGAFRVNDPVAVNFDLLLKN